MTEIKIWAIHDGINLNIITGEVVFSVVHLQDQHHH